VPPVYCCFLREKQVICNGDCDDATFIIKGETGTDVTYSNFVNNLTYDQYGNVSTVTFSGTVIYNDSGNSYQVHGVVHHSPCNYTVTVKNADGEEATCSN
jgi:hypothetical protein